MDTQLDIIDGDFVTIDAGGGNSLPAVYTPQSIIEGTGINHARLAAVLDTMIESINAAFDAVELMNLREDISILQAIVKKARDKESERKVIEIRIRAERKTGEYLLSLTKGRYQPFVDKHTGKKITRSEIGITEKESSRWQALARVEEDTFERLLKSMKTITTTALVEESIRISESTRARDINMTIATFSGGEFNGGTLSETGWVAPEDMTKEEWIEVGKTLCRAEMSVSWWIGDWWNYGENKYGSRKALVGSKDWPGPAYKASADAAWVASKFESSRRRELLGFTHHREVAALPDDKADALLDWCEEPTKYGEKPRTHRELRARVRDIVNGREGTAYSELIKPSDNWSFNPVVYGRIDESGETHGYIPGEVYANVLFYYAKHGDKVCDLMAGSGQIMRVYEDKDTWRRGKEGEFDLDIRMFDRNPRGRYASLIEHHDATKPLPDGYRPDLIFMDPPYFGMVNGAYSDDADDIANMSWEDFESSMQAVAKTCSSAQDSGALVSIIAPNFLVWDHGADGGKGRKSRAGGRRIIVCDHIRQWWRAAGYELHDIAYSSRYIQQNPNIRFDNHDAKKVGVMLTDIAEIQTFIKL